MFCRRSHGIFVCIAFYGCRSGLIDGTWHVLFGYEPGGVTGQRSINGFTKAVVIAAVSGSRLKASLGKLSSAIVRIAAAMRCIEEVELSSLQRIAVDGRSF
jgi:hypothetical protein